jgi:outer membrane receptor protein involved in Fe transport
VPKEYDSDSLVNIEAGWKTMLAGNRVQWNGAIYQEDWKNVQTGIFAPQLGLGNLTVGLNGPEYKVKGVEMSLIWRAAQGLMIQGSGSYNKSELKNSPQLYVNNTSANPPFTAAEIGQPIQYAWVAGQRVSVTNVFGVPGDPLANSPKLQANARARYDWSTVGNDWYVQLGAAYQGSSLSSATHVNQYEMPAWTQWDMSAGVTRGAWTMEIIGQNLTDVNKSVFSSAAQFIRVDVPMRPRTLGLQIGYKFTGGKD